jgi:hypothetical protein
MPEWTQAFGRMFAACVAVAAATLVAATDALATAAPDQVLVLYNKDWAEDLDGSAPGQDSEEVARYYVARHTDPATGKKPYLLGLACVHSKKHLDEFRMVEDKGDNERGVIFKGKGALPDGLIIPCSMTAYSASGGQVVEADRTTVPIQYWGETRKAVEAKRVVIRIGPSEELEKNPLVYDDGKCLKEDWVVEKDGGWTIKLDAFDGGKSKLWFKGVNDKGEVVMVLAGAFMPAANRAEGQPKGIFRTFNAVYPRIGVTKEEVENPDAASVRIAMSATDDPATAKAVWPASAKASDFAEAAPDKSADKPASAKPDDEALALPAAGGRDFLLRPASVGGGTIYAWLTVKGADGKEFTKKAAFFDPREFAGSLTGPDGIPDDKFYQEDIAEPLKKFLEDPANKTPDGKLLKDHILYVVVSYGLPLQVKSAYGIRRGTLSGTAADSGTGSALEQRLAMLYYDDRKFAAPTVVYQNPGSGPGIPTVATPFRATLAGGTIQGGVHPYRHPWAQQDVHGRPDVIPKEREQAHFTSELRQKMGDRFIYLAMRVDNMHPELAKAEVDSAIYATSYMTPKMPGAIKWGKYREGERGAKELKALGFDLTPPTLDDPRRTLFYFGVFGYGNRHLEQEFLPAKSGPQPTFGEKPMPPGALGYAVRSGEQWRGRVRSQFGYYQDKALEAGATVGGGDALGAHITSHSWWDDQVLFHHLFRGWDAAEGMYMSSLYMSWITYYAGDPLYAPDLSKTRPDVEAPLAKPGMPMFDLAFGEGKSGATVRVSCELWQRPGLPEMAEMRVECWPVADPAKKLTGANWRYLARPCASVGGLEPGKTYRYRVILTDPYGNARDSDTLLPGTFTVPKELRAGKLLGEVQLDLEKASWAEAAKLLDQADPERGEIHLAYVVEKESDSALPVVRGPLSFAGNGLKGLSFNAGGAPVDSNMTLANREKPAEWKLDSFATKKDREYRVVLRWSREPLMREIALVAKDGTEFLLGANNFIPWRPASAPSTALGATAGKPAGPSPEKAPSGVRLATPDASGVRIKRVALYDRTDPPPVEHSAVYPHAFDLDAFERAEAK